VAVIQVDANGVIKAGAQLGSTVAAMVAPAVLFCVLVELAKSYTSALAADPAIATNAALASRRLSLFEIRMLVPDS
jgi:hypothetical protein